MSPHKISQTKLQDVVFEFVGYVEKANSLQEVKALFQKTTESFGVEFFVCAQMVLPGGRVKTIPLCRSEQNAWYKYYLKNKLIFDDPLHRITRIMHSPYTWSWACEHFDFSPAEQGVLGQAAEFGLKDGIVFPLHGPAGSSAVFSIAGSSINTSLEDIAAYQVITLATYNKAVKISQIFDGSYDNPLSKRQRECLSWAQYGKSNLEIAAILQLSPHTVKEHIDGAKRALNVDTKIEAIIRAGNANYIGTSPPSDQRTNPKQD